MTEYLAEDGLTIVTTETNENTKTVISTLNIVAIINLVCGFLGAFGFWISMGTYEGYFGNTELNSVGITLGFACLLEGILG